MQRPGNDTVDSAYQRLRHSLRGYLRKRTGDAEITEDLLQDVFLKALVFERTGRKPGNLASWLHAVARTTLADYYRTSGVHMDEIDENMPTQEPEDLRLHEELSICIKSLVEQLDTIYRDTLIATDFEGETMQSLAAKQNVSVSAIKSRASRARRMLKEKLLACCRVEMMDGVVSDYHRIGALSCGGECE